MADICPTCGGALIGTIDKFCPSCAKPIPSASGPPSSPPLASVPPSQPSSARGPGHPKPQQFPTIPIYDPTSLAQPLFRRPSFKGFSFKGFGAMVDGCMVSSLSIGFIVMIIVAGICLLAYIPTMWSSSVDPPSVNNQPRPQQQVNIGTCNDNLRNLKDVCSEACSLDSQTNEYYGGRCSELGTTLPISTFIFGSDDGSTTDQASLVAASVREGIRTGQVAGVDDGNRAYALFDRAKVLSAKLSLADCQVKMD